MKKIILTILTVAILIVMVVGAVACNLPTVTIMAEAGSAGEEVAQKYADDLGKLGNYVSALSQKDVLTEILAQTADIGIIDSIMANYYINTPGSSFNGKLEIVDIEAEEETYAVGLRKEDVYLTQKINKALYDLQEEGKIAEIAAVYGLTDALVTFEEPSVDETLDKTGYNYIIGKGEFIVGYTIFAPISYKNGNDELVGFDTDVAKAVCEKLGVTAKFQEIDWDSKVLELDGKSIDAIWNGMTYTAARAEEMSMSASYLKNKQVAIVKAGSTVMEQTK